MFILGILAAPVLWFLGQLGIVAAAELYNRIPFVKKLNAENEEWKRKHPIQAALGRNKWSKYRQEG